MLKAYVLMSQNNGIRYWKGWSSAPTSGRPCWTNRFSLSCLFRSISYPFKLMNGEGSCHFTPQPNMRVVEVEIKITNQVIPIADNKYLFQELDHAEG